MVAFVLSGGGNRGVPWDTNIEVQGEDGSRDVKVLDLHTALETLEREHSSMAQVVEMHYFAGMTAEEAAAVDTPADPEPTDKA